MSTFRRDNWQRSLSRMSPKIYFINLFSPIILDESKIEFSSFVKTLIDFGLQDINCFTSANPIEPYHRLQVYSYSYTHFLFLH